MFIDDDMDKSRTLHEWVLLFQRLENKFGSNTIAELDAGYNNVSLYIESEEREVEKED